MNFTDYAHLKRWEGCELKAYKDVAGVWTIGYGSTGPHVTPGMVITEQEAKDLLDRDLARFVKAVNSLVKVKINQNQFNALVSLAYNIGIGAFAKSSVLRNLNLGYPEKAADCFLLWNKARINGKLQVVQGLVNRRKSERELFLRPASQKTYDDTIQTTPIDNDQPDFWDWLMPLFRK